MSRRIVSIALLKKMGFYRASSFHPNVFTAADEYDTTSTQTLQRWTIRYTITPDTTHAELRELIHERGFERGKVHGMQLRSTHFYDLLEDRVKYGE